MSGSPRPTSGHSRSARDLRGPLLPPGSSTCFTGLSWLRAARRSSDRSTLPAATLPPCVAVSRRSAVLLEPVPPASMRVDCSPSPGNQPVAGRRLPLPVQTRGLLLPRSTPGSLRSLGCRPTAKAAGRAVLPPHPTMFQGPTTSLPARVRCCTGSSLGGSGRSCEPPLSPSSRRALLSSATHASTGPGPSSTTRIPVRLPRQSAAIARADSPGPNCHCGATATAVTVRATASPSFTHAQPDSDRPVAPPRGTPNCCSSGRH